LIWITASCGFSRLTHFIVECGNIHCRRLSLSGKRRMNQLPGQITTGSAGVAFEDVASDYSRLLLLRGVAALLFAFLVFFWPRLTITGLAMLWGGYSLVDGVLALVAAIRGRSGAPRVWLGLIGSAGLVCAGGTLFALDDVTAHLVGIISIWAITIGAMQVWAALELRKTVDGNWILVLDGLGALLFGLALAFWPDLRAEALLWLIGWFAAAVGSLLVSVGYWLRRTTP
jgi:uncharacterized membrane protein HdeD (DUF308 family)